MKTFGRTGKALSSSVVVISVLMLFPACEKEGPAERAGKNVDKAAENAGEELDKAGDKLEDAANNN